MPLCTPNVRPTISGEIVERRDHVLIAGGFLPPSAIRCSVLATLRSIKGPFFNERGIFLKSQISNFKFEIIFSCDPSRSCSSCVCCDVSCNLVSAVPTGSPGDVRPKSFLHHHRAGDRPGSWQRRE